MAEKIHLQLTVNGEARSVEVHPMARLLDVLRNELRLTGTKEGCGEGECGACSVLFNGRLLNSCLIPAVQAQGAQVTTIEGLAANETFASLMESYLASNAAQCGYCSPGMMLAGADILQRNLAPDLSAIKEGLAGNLCRCTGYAKIVDAVQTASSSASTPSSSSGR